MKRLLCIMLLLLIHSTGLSAEKEIKIGLTLGLTGKYMETAVQGISPLGRGSE